MKESKWKVADFSGSPDTVFISTDELGEHEAGG
jgi:hypothetical protein